MTIEQLAVAALAVWRMTSLLLREDGPFGLFTHWRTFIGRIPGLAPLASCAWCISLWLGVAATLLLFTPAWIVMIPLALSAVTIGLEKRIYDV